MAECNTAYKGVYVCRSCEDDLPDCVDTVFLVSVEEEDWATHTLVIHGGSDLLTLFSRVTSGYYSVTGRQDYGHTRRYLQGCEGEIKWCE